MKNNMNSNKKKKNQKLIQCITQNLVHLQMKILVKEMVKLDTKHLVQSLPKLLE